MKQKRKIAEQGHVNMMNAYAVGALVTTSVGASELGTIPNEGLLVMVSEAAGVGTSEGGTALVGESLGELVGWTVGPAESLGAPGVGLRDKIFVGETVATFVGGNVSPGIPLVGLSDKTFVGGDVRSEGVGLSDTMIVGGEVEALLGGAVVLLDVGLSD